MALRQGFSRLISLQSFSPVPALAHASLGAASALPAACLQPQAQQRRGIISMPVQGNKVARALRSLTRVVFRDNVVKEWRSRDAYMKPAKRRFLAKKETEVRLRKAEFREKLRWAMQRKARGF